MLSIYTLDQCEQWDTVVRTFNKYDVYWLSGYVKAFKLHGDGEPMLFYVEKKNTRAINVVMKRDIAKDNHFNGKLEKNKWFDFSSPYGYGGWIIEGNETEVIFSEYNSWCKKNGVVSEFVRFHPIIKNHQNLTTEYDIIPLSNTVSLDLSSPEIIWKNLTSKNRNMIRKAQKNGIKIYVRRDPEIFKIFRDIYNKTMNKDRADEYYYFSSDFYNSICEDLPENAHVFYAMMNGNIIAASIILSANGFLSYHLSGSISDYSNLAPTNLLLYKAALWGTTNGCNTFHLGGGVGSGIDGLFRFKKSFYRGEELPVFHIGKKIFLSEKYSELMTIREGEMKDNFFPSYRA